jgi:hypothetical protein
MVARMETRGTRIPGLMEDPLTKASMFEQVQAAAVTKKQNFGHLGASFQDRNSMVVVAKIDSMIPESLIIGDRRPTKNTIRIVQTRMTGR